MSSSPSRTRLALALIITAAMLLTGQAARPLQTRTARAAATQA